MELDRLRDQSIASIRIWAPELGDASLLVDECLASALKTFSKEFVCGLSPQAWAKITIIYHKHFLDTESDVSVGEMVLEVVRDSIDTKRMDFLTQNLAVRKSYEQRKQEAASLSLVKK
ncbi:MAG: hypothetical protein P8171_21695 [Candidatus Thiodiazotropha sp.]|jgi:hypothetical protein